MLRTDVAGLPLEWIGYQDAVRLYHLEQVAYPCGSILYRIRGGINARSGQRSVVEVSSIIATYGNSHALRKDGTVVTIYSETTAAQPHNLEQQVLRTDVAHVQPC